MKKKAIIAGGIILTLALGGGGVFLWQKNQAAVAELNNSLPESIRVVKSLFGNEYRVVNKIDGYEFNVPQKWEGLREIGYVPERTEDGYTASGIWFEGKSDEGSRIGSIDRYKIESPNIDIQAWAKKNFKTFGLAGDFSKDVVGNINIVKTQEDVHLAGMSVVFFQKDLVIYGVVNGSEDNIREIIEGGKWQ